jgi:hypothetical protein
VRALDMLPAPLTIARSEAGECEAKARRNPPAFAPASEIQVRRQASIKTAQRNDARRLGRSLPRGPESQTLHLGGWNGRGRSSDFRARGFRLIYWTPLPKS